MMTIVKFMIGISRSYVRQNVGHSEDPVFSAEGTEGVSQGCKSLEITPIMILSSPPTPGIGIPRLSHAVAFAT